MTMNNVKLPVTKLREGKRVARDFDRHVLVVLNARRSENVVDEPTRSKYGEIEIKRRLDELGVIDEQQRLKSEEALARLAGLRAEALAEIDAQVMLSGEDLADTPDYVLLRDGLVDSPDQLRAIAERHRNAAFSQAVAHYAERNDWPGFESMDDADECRDFVVNCFADFERAVRKPGGYFSLAWDGEGENDELRRRAHAYGLLRNFDSGK